MKRSLMLLLAFVIGALGSGYAVYGYMGNMMMWGLYMGASKDSTVYISVLEDIKAGKSDKAVSNLERLLGFSESILRGCENDLCSDESQKMVADALLKIDTYKHKAKLSSDNAN